MSDSLPAVNASLALLAQTCLAAVPAIQTQTDELQKHPLSSLRTDFISLLSLLYSGTTKLSIALNPASPAHAAAITPLKDLIAHSSTLASNAASFLPDVHGRAIAAEVRTIAENVLNALQELALAHVSLLNNPPSSRQNKGAAGEEYLIKTGVVHDLITRAKSDGAEGLSKSNLIAVRRRWREQCAILADAQAELEEDADSEDDDFDDGWDDPELDLGLSSKKSPEQAKLAETILALVKRASLLLDDIRISLLPPLRAPAQPPSNPVLDDLLDSALPFVAAVDGLVTRIYSSPDNPSDLEEARNEFARALAAVASAVKGFWKGKEDTRPASEKGSRAYFVEQFAQLNVATQSVQWAILT
ncbi:hypothetical protein BC834DRAFT_966125 [Gloeopeniophorella convolvens]|nr:hypothetical protein BC834DRAFT_966125 [Gloeopeniophorella convolvens]